MTESEHPGEVRPDDQGVGDEVEWHRIAHDVPGERSSVLRLEGMLVVPELVRSTPLLIHKPALRFPRRDLAAPLEWESVDAQLVVDQGPHPHIDRERRDDLELQQGRGEHLEIGSIGEQREYFVERTWQPEFELDLMHFHGGIVISVGCSGSCTIADACVGG